MKHRLASIAALALAGCAATTTPVSVTRFTAQRDVARGSIAAIGDGVSIEQRSYDAAVARALQRQGFTTGDPATTAYVFSSEVTRDFREGPPRGSPVTIGVGGGTGGYGGGVGLGASFGLGKKRSNGIVATQLAVRLLDRTTRAVVWEGRAQTSGPESSVAGQPAATVDRLADALFRDFPGESGRTITIK